MKKRCVNVLHLSKLTLTPSNSSFDFLKSFRSRSNEIALYGSPETSARLNVEAQDNGVKEDRARYVSRFVDRSIAPLRPSYAFPRLYSKLFQALFDKLRSVPYVDLVNEMDEMMIIRKEKTN